MYCSCGGEKFRTVDVARNRKWNPERAKWVYSEDVDSRLVMCRKCHATWWTETRIVLGHKHNPEQLTSVPVLPGQIELFESRGHE